MCSYFSEVLQCKKNNNIAKNVLNYESGYCRSSKLVQSISNPAVIKLTIG